LPDNIFKRHRDRIIKFLKDKDTLVMDKS
jgi:hypothetical protein